MTEPFDLDARPYPEAFKRLLASVVVNGDGCWLSSRVNGRGYTQLRYLGRKWSGHRLSYEIHTGQQIPKGLVIDHLCRNTACINPKHLEVVTNKENVLRGEGLTAVRAKRTHCIKGHEYTAENTYINRGRHCKTCGRAASRRYQARIELEANITNLLGDK